MGGGERSGGRDGEKGQGEEVGRGNRDGDGREATVRKRTSIRHFPYIIHLTLPSDHTHTTHTIGWDLTGPSIAEWSGRSLAFSSLISRCVVTSLMTLATSTTPSSLVKAANSAALSTLRKGMYLLSVKVSVLV